MIFRWDVCGLLCIVLTYSAVLYADYVVINWLVLPVFDESLWGVFHVVAFNVLLFMLVFAHVRAMVSDPGIVPYSRTQLDFSDMNTNNRISRSDSDSDVSHSYNPYKRSRNNEYVGEDWTVCGRCEAYRPPRAHHCRICRRCVRKMDHHCPWINNCVGEFNQKYFLQFLVYVALSSIYCIGLVISSWLFTCKGGDCGALNTDKIQHTRVLHTIFVTIESALFCLFVAAVCCDQFQAILSDETAVEQVQRRGPHRPGKSKRALLNEVCGPGPVFLWLLPCRSLPHKQDLVHLPGDYVV